MLMPLCPIQSNQKWPWKTSEPEVDSGNSTEQLHSSHLFLSAWYGFASELCWQTKINNISFPLIYATWSLGAWNQNNIAEIYFFPLFLYPWSFAKSSQSHQ